VKYQPVFSPYFSLKLLFMFDLFMPYLCLKVQFDVTFPAVPCSLLSLDAMDISGEQHLDIVCTASSDFLLTNFKS
jgi:hypothetical protein